MVKNPPANAGDTGDVGLTPGSGRSPGGGTGNPFQCFCLENPMDRGTCPWTDSHYGGLYSIALQRVRHDSVTDHAHIWLPPLSVTISSSIHVAANGIISFF